MSPEDRKWLDEKIKEAPQPAPQTTDAGSSDSGEEGTGTLLARGAARGLTDAGIGIGRLASKLNPVNQAMSGIKNLTGRGYNSLEEMAAENVPALQKGYDKVKGFAEGETPTWTEWGGKMVGEALPFAAIPEAAGPRIAGRLVQGAANRFLPASYTRAGGFAGSPWAARGGSLANMAARGAASGAAGDPDNPGWGAVTGGAAGLVPGLGGMYLRGPTGKITGAFIPLTGLGYLLHTHGLWNEAATALGGAGGLAMLLRSAGFQARHMSGVTKAIKKGANIVPATGQKLRPLEKPAAGAVGYGAAKETAPDPADIEPQPRSKEH